MYRVIRSVLKASEEIKPKTLTYLENPSEFLRETEDIVSLMFPQFDFSLIRKVVRRYRETFWWEISGISGMQYQIP